MAEVYEYAKEIDDYVTWRRTGTRPIVDKDEKKKRKKYWLKKKGIKWWHFWKSKKVYTLHPDIILPPPYKVKTNKTESVREKTE